MIRFRPSLTVVALSALLLSSGCADANDGGAGKMLRVAGVGKLDRDTGTQYVALAAKKKATSAFVVINVPRDLWPPFRYEMTAGIFDPAKAWTGGGFFCTEVSVHGSSPLDYYDLCGQPVANGVNVFTADKVGTRMSHLFTGTSRVDYAVEHDGTDLVLSARASGDSGWTELDRFTRPGTAAPWRGSIGASQLAGGQEAGFDGFRFVANGSPPTTPSAPDAAREMIYQALDPQVEAMHALNRASPDTTAAGDQLAAAGPLLIDARAAVDGLLLTKRKNPAKKAGKQLKKAEKKLSAAGKKLSKGKKAKSIVNLLKKAAKAQLIAASELEQSGK